MSIRKKHTSSKSYVSKLILVAALIIIMTIIGCGTNTSSDKGQTNQGTIKGEGVLKTDKTPNTGKESTQSSQAQPAKEVPPAAKTDTPTQPSKENTPAVKTDNQTQTEATKVNPQINKDPIVTITMEDGNTIKIELFPTVAPNTVRNFISLVHKNFYNGLIFHRVIPGFMIQGGDPKGSGQGGPGYNIKGEFNSNGFNNSLKHDRGVLSMARTPQPDSAGSQFFIMVAKAPSLDGQYATFGKVLEGMDEVDKIVNSNKGNNDKPLQDQKMKTVTVETFGVNYPEPEVVK